MKIIYPPTKKSTMEELEKREHNKTRYPGMTDVDFGPLKRIEDNPRAKDFYLRKVAAGVEDIDEYPFLMNGSVNPKNRTPLRERKFGDEGNIDDDIKAWNLRNHPDVLRKKKCATKAKPKRAIKKKVAKKCKCK